jgi:hypothetical protein
MEKIHSLEDFDVKSSSEVKNSQTGRLRENSGMTHVSADCPQNTCKHTNCIESPLPSSLQITSPFDPRFHSVQIIKVNPIKHCHSE